MKYWVKCLSELNQSATYKIVMYSSKKNALFYRVFRLATQTQALLSLLYRYSIWELNSN